MRAETIQAVHLRDRSATRIVIRALQRHSFQQSLCHETSLPQAGSRADMRRPTIFVIDDESSMREAMRALLQDEGLPVEVYSSGEESLTAYSLSRESES
jgi:PleD family two-component response regulator